MRILLLQLALLVSPSLALAESWALLALREGDDPPVESKLEEAREALGTLLPEGGRVLSREETNLRFGFPTATATDLKQVLAEAEMLYFQLEYAAAQEKLEKALEALSRDRDEIPLELGRGVRLLLALVQLREDREAAAATLRPLAAISPLSDSQRRTTPEAVAALWDEVRTALSARAEGWLVVDCTGCHGGEVWLEGLPVGTTQRSIGLAPGVYRLVLRGLAGAEGKRSLARQVRIRSGEETRLRIDLAAEAALIDDGPSLVAEAGSSLDRAAYVAGLLGVERVLLWRFAEESATIEVWEVGAEEGGAWSRELRDESFEEGLAALAEEILGVASPTEMVETELVEASLASAQPPPFLRKEASRTWSSAARWPALGTTVALVGVATWLTLDTASAAAELDALERSGGYGSVQEGRRAEALADSIGKRRTWNTVVWAGAAAGAVATLLLFLDSGPEAAGHVDGISGGR